MKNKSVGYVNLPLKSTKTLNGQVFSGTKLVMESGKFQSVAEVAVRGLWALIGGLVLSFSSYGLVNEFHWGEVLSSRAWCTVVDNGKFLQDRAHVYQFAMDRKLSTEIYGRHGKIPQQNGDQGTWSVEQDRLIVSSEGLSASFTVSAVPPVQAAKDSFVEPGLTKGAAFCISMKNEKWSAIHCPCLAVRFAPGFDI